MALPQIDRIVAFDFIRLIAIVFVLFSHLLYVGDSSLLHTFKGLMGIIGNGLFFFMSGYLIYRNNNYFKTPSSIVEFYKKRAIRIYPLYWLALLIFVLVTSIILAVDYNLQTVFTYFIGAQMIFMPKYVVDIPYYWFVSAILLYYFIYPYIVQNDLNTKNYVLRAIIVFGLLLLVRVSTGLIEGRFFEYYPVFIVGVLCSKENFLCSTTYHSLKKGIPAILLACLVIVGITKPKMFDNLQVLNLELLFNVGLIMLLRIVIIFSSIVLLYWLLSECSCNSTINQGISACAFATYGVYLFHNTYFILANQFFSIYLNLDENLKSFTFLSIGSVLLFVLAYHIQSFTDRIQNQISKERGQETLWHCIIRHIR